MEEALASWFSRRETPKRDVWVGSRLSATSSTPAWNVRLYSNRPGAPERS